MIAHHRFDAVLPESSRWVSGFGLAATITLAVGLVLALLWVAGPARARTRPLLRLALVALAAAGVLAACSGEADPLVYTPGEDPTDQEPAVLFTSAGGDALAEEIRTEGDQPGTGTGLPDLVGFTGRNFTTMEVGFAGRTMLVYSFDGIVGNAGTGPLDIFGNPQLSDPSDPESHDVWQRTWDGTSWTNVTKPPIRFEAADGHNHFHLMELARYGLHDIDSDAMIAPSHKVGFCFLDSQPLAFWSGGKSFEGAAQIGDASPRPYAAFNRTESYCRAGTPHAEALHMGISPGWGDLYAETLSLQWVDISNVAPGRYRLSSLMDPNDVIVESDETNNGPVFAEDTMTVRGYNAAPVQADSNGEPVAIALASESFGRGMPEPTYTIVRAPEGGTLDVPLGEPLTSATVTFTPDPGFSGHATFDYSARTTGSPYPFNPTAATATIAVNTTESASLTIAGFRPVVDAGGGIDLSIHDPADPESELAGAVWAVNGVEGGDGVLGTITPSGFYQAPVGEGRVLVSATLPDGRSATTDLTIAFSANTAPFIDEPVTYEGDGEIVSSDPASPARKLTPVTAGEPLAILVPVVDLNGDPLLITSQGLPGGLSLNITTGAITGTPAVAGEYDVTVAATDGMVETTRTFRLTVTG